RRRRCHRGYSVRPPPPDRPRQRLRARPPRRPRSASDSSTRSPECHDAIARMASGKAFRTCIFPRDPHSGESSPRPDAWAVRINVMPIYEFECTDCGERFERLQKLSDADPTDCPTCGKPRVKRRLTAPAFRLAGSGWYETDFKKDGDRKRNLAG